MKNAVHDKRTALKLMLAGAGALFLTTPAGAHHSYALFDHAKLTSLVGTVKEWKWANPHVYLMIDVKKADGTSEEWTLVGSSPNMMSRWGWNAADVKVGDQLTIDLYRAVDGKPIGQLSAVFFSGGRVLLDPAGKSGEDLASGPSKLPNKPQGEAYK
ncbi:DUF6152 family protein [Methylocella silvestris]|uniref:Uncharacterized protein n=1 Tax=Methylocella silvestris TaxID=199596 RepID=A0A2J7TCA5_METSI|nr:DUF6152 family protein [Methylocella silvestris]PNG24389.1 hypothetical protein CR492_19065 [Methylocella silvestris]